MPRVGVEPMSPMQTVVPPPAPKQSGVLELEGLCKSFGPVRAVDGLDLTVHQGEIFGFLGPNGAGKTTVIKMICGVLTPDSGKITLNGAAMTDNMTGSRKRLLGMCPQETVLWNLLTCSEQLIFMARMYGIPARKARLRSEELLEKLGLTEKSHSLAGTLSGGMKRRLNIALALIHDPQIVVLDEPEAGLDPQSRVMVREFIRSLAPQKTVVFTSHNMDEVERLCQRAAIMDHGRLLVQDTVERLKQSAGDGDIVEITLSNAPMTLTEMEAHLRRCIGEKLRYVSLRNGRLSVRLLEASHILPRLLEALGETNTRYSDIAFRWNTLEDVFINLTGRSLRQ